MSIQPRFNKFLLAAAVLLMLGAVVLLLTQNKSAPAVSFATLTGDKLPMESLRGKVVLVSFWATSCPGCIQEMPALVKIYQKYRVKGLETVAVAMRYDHPALVANYTRQHALPFIVALDLEGEIAHDFGDVHLTPTLFLIGKRGDILQQTVGEPDFTKLDALIEKELAS
jgi:peroxiredoxin